MPRVLAIEPNYDLGSTLRRTLSDHGDDVLVVDSKAAALESVRLEVPDLILMSPLLSPTDEDDLFDCLKSLPGTAHVQTLNIPQFKFTPQTTAKSKFSFLRGRRDPTAGGCDPGIFANEVSEYLERAAALKGELGECAPPSAEIAPPVGDVDKPLEVDTPVTATLPEPTETVPVPSPGAPSILLSNEAEHEEVEHQTDRGGSEMSGSSIFLYDDDASSDTQTEEIADIRRKAEAQAKTAESLAAELARVKEQTEQQVARELAPGAERGR